jgi:hypothetical protein
VEVSPKSTHQNTEISFIITENSRDGGGASSLSCENRNKTKRRKRVSELCGKEEEVEGTGGVKMSKHHVKNKRWRNQETRRYFQLMFTKMRKISLKSTDLKSNYYQRNFRPHRRDNCLSQRDGKF